jgi:hypothetical protein
MHTSKVIGIFPDFRLRVSMALLSFSHFPVVQFETNHMTLHLLRLTHKKTSKRKVHSMLVGNDAKLRVLLSSAKCCIGRNSTFHAQAWLIAKFNFNADF